MRPISARVPHWFCATSLLACVVTACGGGAVGAHYAISEHGGPAAMHHPAWLLGLGVAGFGGIVASITADQSDRVTQISALVGAAGSGLTLLPVMYALTLLLGDWATLDPDEKTYGIGQLTASAVTLAASFCCGLVVVAQDARRRREVAAQ